MSRHFDSFEEFWPYYVGEHMRASTRQIHFAGTVAGIVFACHGEIIAALVVAYGAAWFSHFFVENNRPATFKHPVYSFMGDFRMLRLMLEGKMDEEVVRLIKTGALKRPEPEKTAA
jgi:hypothetical protein